ncbi:MAG: phenylalanine--tRNA ligase subunit beta, partial [Acutalibacteraceae bacterium]
MNLSMRWLNDFVDVKMPPREFSEAITISGSKVESFTKEGSEISNVVVGEILKIEDHPDSDHLLICQVDVGKDEPIQIVTGAPNTRECKKVPVALDGSTLPGNVKIKKGKLRGVLSNGMMCSLGELGLTVNDFPYAIEDGLFNIEEDCAPGDDIHEALGFNDTCVEFEITSNRPDCFSVMGLAREAAATFDKEFKTHTPKVKGGHGDCSSLIDVKIEEPSLCPIYCAKVVKNVRVKPSPRWMRERLRAMGVRPINNIVDITNFVMLEYGQPMHAFDKRFIDDDKIRVRLAKEGEKITTLDGIERELLKTNLVIADSHKPVAIAGVMGGEFSGIMDDTTEIVFESATFNGASVRLTAKSQGMRTDASARYEKGLDPNACLPALMRACELVEMLDAGDVMDGVIMDKHFSEHRHTIKLETEWTNKFLATNIQEEEMIKMIEKIECEVKDGIIYVPTFRPDLVHKADIAEEIARFYGYNNIENSVSMGGNCQGKYTQRQKFDKKIGDSMLALGFSEIMTYSFISPKYYDKVMMPADSPLRKSITIKNPLGEDTSIMRTSALPSMMEILSKNFNHKNGDVALYEIAKEYIPTTDDKLPNENNILMAGAYGKDVDFFTIKGAFENILKKANVKEYDVVKDLEAFGFHPGRTARFTVDGKFLATVGEIHPLVCKNYGINTKVYVFRADLDYLFNVSVSERKYTPMPKYPAVSRDIAVVCDRETPVLTLKKAIEKSAKNLESVRLFDVYEGEQIEEGKKSVAFNIT